jgi:hypothetical protein
MSGSLAHAERPGDLAHSTVIDRGVMPVSDVVARVRRIQEVMSALMKEGTHYGKIPGTDKPTLYKPGAELILTTFRISATPALIEDLSSDDEIRYRVTVRGTNQTTGEVLGEMSGECSSNEEKYRWRRPVCDEEFAEAPEDRRREKWARGQGKAYKQKQIRTSPADVANTILKMAVKRALIAMTLVTTSCSDIFAQDLEDLPEELRESVSDQHDAKPSIQPPQRKSETKKEEAPAADGQVTAPALLLSVKKPNGKNFHVLKLKGDDRFFTTFSETVVTAAETLAGTTTKVCLTFVEKVAGDKSYFNVNGITPVGAPQATPAAEAEVTASDIFGGGERQPGEDD